MKKPFLILIVILSYVNFYAQDTVVFNENLAKSLKSDEFGMKKYVFCILKTGTNTTATKEERTKFFEGHMANINKLADDGKLVLAGPFMKNDRNYRGIFIFNVETLEEAQILVNLDPAVQAKIFEAELTPWYGSAAIQEVSKIHKTIQKTKI
jgi:uncharacterized protein YciI